MKIIIAVWMNEKQLLKQFGAEIIFIQVKVKIAPSLISCDYPLTVSCICVLLVIISLIAVMCVRGELSGFCG